jgi:hypothetical protein
MALKTNRRRPRRLKIAHLPTTVDEGARPALRAQLAQQNQVPSSSRRLPMMRHLQWEHVGASFWMAHSKLSNV